MPSFFGEGNTPLVTDTRWRALEKILGATVDGGGGSNAFSTGSGSPEGTVTGNPGDRYGDDNTGTLYTKWLGTGTTGWQVG